MRLIKKSALLVGLGLFFNGSNLFAADQDALTKAVVKLIKGYHELEMYSNQTHTQAQQNKIEIDKLKVRLTKDEKTFSSGISKNKSNIEINKNNILENKGNIKKLQEKIDYIENTYKKANLMIIESKNQVFEANKILKELKEEFKKLKTQSDTSLYKSNISEQKAELLIKSLGELSTNLKQQLMKQDQMLKNLKNRIDSMQEALNNKIENQNYMIKKLKDNFMAYKQEQNKNNIKLAKTIENLKSQIDVMKTRYDAEIKILKTKFDRTKPVYILDEKVKLEKCKDGNCSKDQTDEETIKNFLNQ
jgi:DNA repair exonuclease SbcCD ATPase subunit